MKRYKDLTCKLCLENSTSWASSFSCVIVIQITLSAILTLMCFFSMNEVGVVSSFTIVCSLLKHLLVSHSLLTENKRKKEG